MKAVMFPAKPSPIQFDTSLSMPRSHSMRNLSDSQMTFPLGGTLGVLNVEPGKLRKSTSEINVARLYADKDPPFLKELEKDKESKVKVGLAPLPKMTAKVMWRNLQVGYGPYVLKGT